MMGGMMQVESLSQVCDGFMPFFVTSACTYDTLAALQLVIFVLPYMDILSLRCAECKE